ncbi:hypothetical protein [Planomonospora sp. ID82291]|uniref:hypothetical protein n=1 Tax=Planomonospora sp. ID82291 TaxID=2738136 RepID=UPI0018C3A7DD|nr:hypothetical protein [Planomonospora sp. ID82291]MBG0816655.1 hypothetical protein [Planomonospora sp. ID82291]
MPTHALAGHLVIATAPLAALLALVYAWRPTARRRLRLPLLAAGVLNMALVGWAATAGSTLLDTFKASGRTTDGELATAVVHAHQADALSVASLALLLAVLALVWWLLAPGRPPTTGATAAACVLSACALAVCWFDATTLIEATRSVWSHHPLWQG